MDKIADKINALREKYPSLRTKPDYYRESAVKAPCFSCVDEVAHFS